MDDTTSSRQMVSAFEVEVQPPTRRSLGTQRRTSATLSDGRRATLTMADGTATPKDIMVNLVTGGLGTGILCLPWLTAGASLLPGIVIIIAVLLVNTWTVAILVDAGEKCQKFDFGSLLSTLPGQIGASLQVIVNVIVWLSTFLCLISYINVIADSFLKVLPKGLARWPIVLASAGTVCPFCFLDQSRLSFTSMLSVIAFTYVFVLLISKLFSSGAHAHACYVGLGKGSIAMVGGMANCVIVQMCVLPMYAELKDRSPSLMMAIVKKSFLLLFVLFAGFSVLGYLVYGPTVKDDVLSNIGGDGIANLVAQLGICVAVIGVYPILVSPMLAPLRSEGKLQQYIPHTIVAIVAASGIFALFLTSLGTLSVINGAVCAGIFVGALPAAAGYYILQKPMGQMATLVVVGAVAVVLGIVFMDNYATEMNCLSR